MKKLYIALALSAVSAQVFAQSAIDAYRFSQPDMKGTARFMSMGGAFGALGGDLSTLSQNPAGIGVYRSNELGVTVNLDLQHSSATSQGIKSSVNQTKFLLNNIGGVATMKLGVGALQNINFGFTYNKAVSFNRRYSGVIPQLSNSMTNYIAGIANNSELTVGDVTSTSTYDPYNPNDGGIQSPWLTILGYDSYFITPEGDPDNPRWNGQWGQGTMGTGRFEVETSGAVNEYNLALGGNINNTVYWGMNFDIVDLNYNMSALWGESLQDAWVAQKNSTVVDKTTSNWNMRNLYSVNGTGFNYQLGVIVKPIQELRLGFAFHTPTWYNMTETFSAGTSCRYGNHSEDVSAQTNNGYNATNDMSFRTPWKFIFSAATVLDGKFILSADYEYQAYDTMHFSEPNNYYYGNDWDWDWNYFGYANSPSAANLDPYYAENQDIKNVYRSTSTFRLGAEYRVTPKFSVRAGYSFVSSPVKMEAQNDRMTIYTAGTLPNYRFDKDTIYVTCGLGYRTGGFYIDMAYVFKTMSSTYHAYTPDPTDLMNVAPSAALKLNNSQIVLSTGFRF